MKIFSNLNRVAAISTGVSRILHRWRWIVAVCCVTITTNVHAVSWTVSELVQMMQQAQSNGQPFDQLLANKVLQELNNAGFRVIDDTLVYSTTVAPTSTRVDPAGVLASFFEADATWLPEVDRAGLGNCNTLIPNGNFYGMRTSSADVSAKFNGAGTYIGVETNPSQIFLKLGVNAETIAHTQLGMESCGKVVWPASCQLWGKNPICPPPICTPSICYKKKLGVRIPYPCVKCAPAPCPDICVLPGLPTEVDEYWVDWAPADVIGKIKGTVTLALNHGFSVVGNTVTINVGADLDAKLTHVPNVLLGPVVPDIRPINVPMPPFPGPVVPHVITAPRFQSLSAHTAAIVAAAQSVGLNDELYQLVVMDKVVKQQQKQLNGIIGNYFPMQLQLPSIQDFSNLDPASQVLVKLVLDYLRDHADIIGQFALDIVQQHWTEVLYYVITGNKIALAQFFAAQTVCPSMTTLKVNMPTMPLYSNASGNCSAIDPKNPGAGPYFADAACRAQIGYQPEDFNTFCQESLTSRPNPLLGNAAAWPTLNIANDVYSNLPYPSTNWTLPSAAQLAVGVEPIKQNNIPFVKRVNFRQVNNCALEMRVYKKDISATQLKPLLWIHGGAWTYRSSGYLSLESLVSNYTEDGFVVFAPFYRLTGDKDANIECRNATWQDVAQDVEAALDWVKANGATFGASDTTRIAVTGQSAGAHLAGWLMTHRPLDINRGMLVYPPADMHDFLVRLQGVNGATFPPLTDAAATPYDVRPAQETVETFLQLPLGTAATVDLNNPPLFVTANSYADIVKVAPTSYPPAFILHGTRDSLLTHSQSTVLCNAYGGTVPDSGAVSADLRTVYPCGANSQLHLFKEAGHAFEVCPYPDIPVICRAGSAASAALLSSSLQQGRQWLKLP